MPDFEIIDGVRRAKAAEMAGHTTIRAQLLGKDGTILTEQDVSIEQLRSPKATIRRLTAADHRRWNRILQGSKQDPLPFPFILVQSGNRGIKIRDVKFEFGSQP